MKNTFQASIAHLLEQACPSIQYRVRREILGERPDSSEMRRPQKKILQDDLVREVFSWQQPDGWMGRDFHGEHSLETGIRILREKGVEARHPRIVRALAALAKYPDRLSRGFGFPGAALDEARLGGAQMARAAVFACAGSEEPAFVKEQIQIALQGFISVAELHTLEGLYRPYRGKLVWNRPVDWPGLYHLRRPGFPHRCGLDGVVSPHGIAGAPGGRFAGARHQATGRPTADHAGIGKRPLPETCRAPQFSKMGSLHRHGIGKGLESCSSQGQRPDLQKPLDPGGIEQY